MLFSMLVILTLSKPGETNPSPGMWVLKKWSKSRALEQLTLTDHEDPKKTFLYQLSLTGGLQHFQNVLLVSSPRDQYAPYHSARIEPTLAASKDSKWGKTLLHRFPLLSTSWQDRFTPRCVRICCVRWRM
jgi:hypothetical protein